MSAETKVVFITGGNRGIGFETARELGERGMVVVLGSRELEKGKAAAAKLVEKGIAAAALKCDVTDPADYQGIYDYFEKEYGKLDILVNNAGITIRNPSAAEIPMNDLRKMFETNFFGLVGLTQKLLPLIKKSSAGRIVNVSSVMGSLTLLSDPSSWIYNLKTFAYGASKAALNAFTICLAHELRDTKVKVNSADPGWVKTDMGGPSALLELSEGGKTTSLLATLPDDGPTGSFMRFDREFPW
jgi:NAD(P)-dependent dehydrogenase (short-subunit alcohol dehydrogenase family)